MKNNHIDGRYKCRLCKIGFAMIDEAARHFNEKHDGVDWALNKRVLIGREWWKRSK